MRDYTVDDLEVLTEALEEDFYNKEKRDFAKLEFLGGYTLVVNAKKNEQGKITKRMREIYTSLTERRKTAQEQEQEGRALAQKRYYTNPEVYERAFQLTATTQTDTE